MTAPSASAPSGKPQSGLIRLALAATILLVIVAGAAFYYASQLRQNSKPAGDVVTVTITATTCEPNDLTVPAGTVDFAIVNASDRAVEWEILDGVMVVEERENIAPGFTQAIAARLVPGDFAITCGLLSNPRGTLHVTPSAAATAAAAAQPTLTAFIGPLAEYKVFLTLKANAFLKAATALADAVKAGDLDAAKTLYPAARAAYGQIELEASRFADLHNSIDGLADYLEQREADPAFTGLHRIEYGLFKQDSADGLAPIADKLVADATALQQRLKDARTQPADLSGNAQRVATAAAAAAAAGEDHYADTDLAAFAANLDGVRKVASLLGPVSPSGARDLIDGLNADIGALSDRLDGFRKGDFYAPYAEVPAEARQDIADRFTALAARIGELDTALGLN